MNLLLIVIILLLLNVLLLQVFILYRFEKMTVQQMEKLAEAIKYYRAALGATEKPLIEYDLMIKKLMRKWWHDSRWRERYMRETGWKENL